MGWFFYNNKNIGKKEIIDLLMKDDFLDGYNLIEYKVAANNLWYLLSRPDGTKTIGLYMLQSGGNESGWGYQGMSEDSGPYQLNCPLSLLEKADPPTSDYAKEWRDKVLAANSKKKELRSKLAPKVVVRVNQREFELICKQPRSSTWTVKEIATGKFFSIAKSVMAEAEIVEDSKNDASEAFTSQAILFSDECEVA